MVAAAGYAPALYSITPLQGRLRAVAMELLAEDDGWQLYNAATATPAAKDAVKHAYLTAFTSRDGAETVEYVHGDLRYGNVLIRTNAAGDVGEVKFLDFNWAGRAGEVRYPHNMNVELWRAVGLHDAWPEFAIKRAHDLHWLEGKLRGELPSQQEHVTIPLDWLSLLDAWR